MWLDDGNSTVYVREPPNFSTPLSIVTVWNSPPSNTLGPRKKTQIEVKWTEDRIFQNKVKIFLTTQCVLKKKLCKHISYYCLRYKHREVVKILNCVKAKIPEIIRSNVKVWKVFGMKT